jgi:hypothetical protein
MFTVSAANTTYTRTQIDVFVFVVFLEEISLGEGTVGEGNHHPWSYAIKRNGRINPIRSTLISIDPEFYLL